MEDIKKKRLMDAVDQITDAYGRHTITLGKAFTKDGWQMKREFLSPCVTTDILVVPGGGEVNYIFICSLLSGPKSGVLGKS